ncbi:hypothetical protein BJX61DRAFT_540631 [Aspergillus egyptiacus]|nr:hypothetical protein BJX61DRAFT_540631 [Aspergillus egyptiacus]
MRRRIVHFYYAALTLRQIPDHFDALRNEKAMPRAKVFNRAGAPWEGDLLCLKYAILQVYKHWPMSLDNDNASSFEPAGCPVQFTDEEIRKCEYEHDQEEEKIQELCERDLIGTDSLGWVPHEQFKRSQEVVHAIKAGLMEQSSTEAERSALQDHFPFDDHEEDT